MEIHAEHNAEVASLEERGSGLESELREAVEEEEARKAAAVEEWREIDPEGLKFDRKQIELTSASVLDAVEQLCADQRPQQELQALRKTRAQGMEREQACELASMTASATTAQCGVSVCRRRRGVGWVASACVAPFAAVDAVNPLHCVRAERASLGACAPGCHPLQ